MAKKTYAAVMKQLSNKKAQYEKGLAEAQRTGNQGGIVDYNRRLAKLAAGMDQLFEAQEAAKAPKTPQMMYGGKTKYANGGLTQTDFALYKFYKATPSQELTAKERMQLAQLQTKYDNAVARGWNEDLGFNADGSMAGTVLSSADVVEQAPEAAAADTTDLAGTNIPDFMLARNNGLADTRRDMSFGYNDRKAAEEAARAAAPKEPLPQGDDIPWWSSRHRANRKADMNQDMSFGYRGAGNPAPEETPAPADTTPVTPTPSAPKDPVQRGGMLLDPFMQEMNEQIMAGAPQQPASTPSTTTGTGTGTRTRPEFTPIQPIGLRGPSQIESSVAGQRALQEESPYGELRVDLRPGSSIYEDTSPVTPTKSHGLGDLKNRIFGGQRQGDGSGFDGKALGMAIGGAAQLLPQLAAKRRMQDVEGPVDTPMQRMQMMNTDIQTGAAIQNIKQAQANTNAMLDRNFSNPAIANAMKRAAARETQAQIGNIAFNEAAKETELRNQNMMRATDTLNANALIDAQNRQRQIDFRNDLRSAMGQQDMLMGQTLGNIAMDFQNRAADEKRWNLYKNMFSQGILDRNDIDPLG